VFRGGMITELTRHVPVVRDSLMLEPARLGKKEGPEVSQSHKLKAVEKMIQNLSFCEENHKNSLSHNRILLSHVYILTLYLQALTQDTAISIH
jgi:hypothetical protein